MNKFFPINKLRDELVSNQKYGFEIVVYPDGFIKVVPRGYLAVLNEVVIKNKDEIVRDII